MRGLRRSAFAWAAVVYLFGSPIPLLAGPIRDRLDEAGTEYAKTIERASVDFMAAFDDQIKLVSQMGDLDAVEKLRSQRAAFVTEKALPDASAMGLARSRYKEAASSAEMRLKGAY